MKSQALFSSIDKSKNLKCHLLQFLFGTLRVNVKPTHVGHTETGLQFKDGLPYLYHTFRNKYFNKISLGNMLYFQNKL